MTHLTPAPSVGPRRRAIALLRLAVLLPALAAVLPLSAQNVHINPSTGSFIMANTTGIGYDEGGAKDGYRSLWRHSQLQITMITGDRPNLTPGGEIAMPAGDLSASSDGKDIIVHGGQKEDVYFSLSLPQGFRMTGYRMVLRNDLKGTTLTAGSKEIGQYALVMYETDNTFGYSQPNAQSETMSNADATDTKEYVVTRTSLNRGADMGNKLYFRLHCPGTGDGTGTGSGLGKYFGCTIKEFTVYFTAEADTRIKVMPHHIDATGVSVHECSFPTGRPELGELTPYTAGTEKLYAYDVLNFKSLMGHTYLYESSATKTNADGTAYVVADGTVGSITSEYFDGYDGSTDGRGYYYGLAATGQEGKTYYVETPVEGTTQTGGKLPLSYRIVGAEIEYRYGKTVTGGEAHNFGMITYTKDGTTYYLDSDAKFTAERDDAAQWEFDDDAQVPTVHTVDPTLDSREIYLIHMTETRGGTEYEELTHTYYAPGTHTTLTSDSYVRRKAEEGVEYLVYGTAMEKESQGGSGKYKHGSSEWNILQGAADGSDIPLFKVGGTTGRAVVATATKAAFTPTPYTITFYDKTGTEIVSKTVSSATDDGIYTITDLNNDAIKFKISGMTGTTGNPRALVRVVLTVQALNPYMNRVKVVCHGPVENREIAQEFSTNDFQVRGEKVHMYVPTGFMSSADGTLSTAACSFTFEDLYNRYGEAYYDATTGHSRYSFVKSTYYDGFSSLYATEYSPDASYTSKVEVTNVGTKPFKNNNLAEIAGEKKATGQTTFAEHSFTVAGYLAQSDNPEFKQLTLQNPGSATVYLFTSDETRYNIAPTTAWQHRAHAYYKLDMDFAVKDFTPRHRWTKIYDRTYYPRPVRAKNAKNASYAADSKATDAMWGLTLWADVKDATPSTAPTADESQKGYMTYVDLSRIVHRYLKESNETDADGPTHPYQILYIDGQALSSILYNKGTHTDTDGKTYNSLQGLRRDTLAVNALIYLPNNQTINEPNCMRSTDAGANRACQNIVITDKQPFFAPKFIQVPAASYVKYERQVNAIPNSDENGKATIMLPFTIAVDENGKHTNADGTAFTVYTMEQSNCLGTKQEEPGKPYNYFSQYGDGLTETEPNTPYLIKVEGYNTGGNNRFSFTQTGSRIEESPADASATNECISSGMVDGSTATGSLDGASVTLTGHGTYNGVQHAKDGADGAGGYFYFTNNTLANSHFITNSQTMNIAPFRAYYDYPTQSKAKMNGIRSLTIAFGENPDAGAVTGISAAEAGPSFTIATRQGGAEITAHTACDVTIATAAGMVAATMTLKGGETRSVTLAPGVYVAGGRKVTVR